ncbi:MAG: hypothetical protein CEO21_281, partial [Microgenomates group bacterium Gr01-1014_80]
MKKKYLLISVVIFPIILIPIYILLINLLTPEDHFLPPVFSNTLSARGENFKVSIKEENGLPKQEFVSGKAKITATLTNTHLKIDSSALPNFLPVAKADYQLTDNVALEYQVYKDSPEGKIAGPSTKGIKEDIVLKDKESPRSFQFQLDLEGISRWTNKDNNWYFYSDDCQSQQNTPQDTPGVESPDTPGVEKNCPPVFYIPQAYMEDAKGEKSYSVLQEVRPCPTSNIQPPNPSSSFQHPTSNCALLYIAADSEWLDSEDRAWPVKIDPSIIVGGGIVEAETQFGGLQRKLVYANNYWYAFYNDGGQILYKKSQNGSKWTNSSDVDSTDTDNYNPSIWHESQYIYVAWIDNSADAIEVNRIDTSSSDSLGTKCTSADQGTIDTTSFTTSISVADDGTVYIAYSDTSTDTEADVLKLTFSGCTFTSLASATTVYLTTADTSPWTVPSDWTNTNTIRTIGGGGAGDNLSTGGGGGGGGSYSAITNTTALTAGATVGFSIGAGGTDGVNGGNTWFCNTTASCANFTDTNVIVSSAGGTTAT